MQAFKALQLVLEQSQNVTRNCTHPGCTETTREGKDFCSNHVEEQPYVRDLLRRLSERNDEDERVRMEGSKAVNLSGITAKEMLLELRRAGFRTEERLTRELRIDKNIIHSYAIRMQNEGITAFGRGSRDNLKVILLNFDPAHAIEDDDEDGDDRSVPSLETE